MLHQDIAIKHLSHDCAHLPNDGTHMFADILVDFINYFILDSNAFDNVD